MASGRERPPTCFARLINRRADVSTGVLTSARAERVLTSQRLLCRCLNAPRPSTPLSRLTGLPEPDPRFGGHVVRTDCRGIVGRFTATRVRLRTRLRFRMRLRKRSPRFRVRPVAVPRRPAPTQAASSTAREGRYCLADAGDESESASENANANGNARANAIGDVRRSRDR